MPIIPIDELKKDLVIKTTLKGQPLIFNTTWGLFSPEKIDEGTEVLLSNLDIKPTDSVLDLGCGYGPIGIALAKASSTHTSSGNFEGSLHMIDKDFVAVEYAKKNATINGIKADCYLSNGFSHVAPNKKFDLIVSNLPAKVSKEFFWILFEEAKQHLNPGGRIIVVTIAGLDYFVQKNFEKIIGNYEQIAKEKGYFVGSATLTDN